jgi:putative selenate reductase
MHPFDIDTLARAVTHEHESCGRIFGIPTALFAPAATDPRLRCAHMGVRLDNPLGVAAGPHTQLAQNIVAAYLVGARFIELKTVQILDRLEVTKPCIDMRDLGYNCEWSQELSLEQSFDQYASAFALVHALCEARGGDPGGFGFDMSVGYDLAGIRSAEVRRFVDRMRDAGDEIAVRADAVRRAFAGTALAVPGLELPTRISNDVTLSTMHGCPPEEIERIGRFLIEELGLHTTIKLNPTLLGPERLRVLLHERLGHTGVEVPDAAFEHDPRFEDACGIIASLRSAAQRAGVRFAVKLTNTLETRNVGKALPEKEALHYMSGRALHPISVAVAALVAERFAGAIPISLAGGVDAFNAADVLLCGVRPLTVSSDLLRVGGYGRLSQYLAEIGARFDAAGVDRLEALPLDPIRLAAYAERAASDPRYAKRGARPVFSSKRSLAPVDCMAAPCRERCPAHQDAPAYLRLAAERNADEALAVILRDNPLPGTTGCVCHHPCTTECTRNLLDDPVAIREVKRWAEGLAPVTPSPTRGGGCRSGEAPEGGEVSISVGILGAGPAGLAAAAFCRRAGFEVTVYEAKGRVGGVPAAAIPAFRLPGEVIERDLARLAALGVRFELGRTLGGDLDPNALRAIHDAVFVATGAGLGQRLEVPGEQAEGVHDAIDFLERAKAGDPPRLGTRVLVVGGGNSAMDAARAAKRLVGDSGSVTVVYRRSRDEMPAALEEIEEAIAEGISIETLLAPGRVLNDAGSRVAGLECLVMALGEPDASGRRRPVPVDGRRRALDADAILVAIGQGRGALGAAAWEGIDGVFAGGDAVRGAATIIEAVADARAFADALSASSPARPEEAEGRLEGRSSAVVARLDVNEALARRSRRAFREADAVREAARCLGCDTLCALCVTVCPNRANVLYEVEPGAGAFAQRYQTANVADLCNGCGNCAAFCPTGGAPYRDKPRVCLSDAAAREIASGTAFRLRPGGWSLVSEEGATDAERARLADLGDALLAAFGHLA